jgi:hypothetical protein
MAYADYEHCPGCDGKVIYTGDVDVPGDVMCWHQACLDLVHAEQAETALVAERGRWREECGVGGNDTDPLALCWETPAGWPADVPDPPHCNRLTGHPGNHICHAVWGDAGVTGGGSGG